MADQATLVGLPGEQVVCTTAAACAERLADGLVAELRGRLAATERAHLALSGGSSGKLLAAALARRNDVGAGEWARIDLWMVDERCVGDGDPRLNFGAIRDALVPRLPIPSANLHPMPVLRAGGADRYEHALRDALGERAQPSDRRLDAVVLGMGPDGHTASLFPKSPALEERQRWIVLNDGAEVVPPRPRMTMTFSLLGQARFIALLVTGPTKHAALRRLAEGREDYRTLPMAGLAPSPTSRLVWYLDRDAVAG